MIVINARFLTQEMRGVQRFAEQICLQLKGLRDDLVFVAPHDIHLHESAEQLQVRRIGRHRGQLWEQLDLPLWLLRNGSPPLEAQGCGCPVLAAREAAIPEVLGDSALYFDPLKVNDIADCMQRVLRDEALRQDLRRRGKANVARYCWSSSAQQVSRLIDQAFTGVRNGGKSGLRQLPLGQPKH